jgi:hypothetical protein
MLLKVLEHGVVSVFPAAHKVITKATRPRSIKGPQDGRLMQEHHTKRA